MPLHLQPSVVHKSMQWIPIALFLLATSVAAQLPFGPDGDPFYAINDSGVQYWADVAVAGNGDYAVTYWDTGVDPESEIRVRVFNADGTPKAASSRVDANTSVVDGDLRLPAIAALANSSGWIVVWQSDNQDGSDYGIYGQRLTALGARVGNEFLVNQSTDSNQKSAEVAALPFGGFVAAWTSEVATLGEEVAARIFDSAASPVTDEFFVNTPSAFDDEKPRIGVDTGGNILITWEGDTNDSGDEDIYVRRFDDGGIPLSGQVTVNSATSGDQESPDIAVRADGSYVVAWTDRDTDPDKGYARAYTSASVPVGTPFEVGKAGLIHSQVRIAYPGNDLIVALTRNYEAGFINGEIAIGTYHADGTLIGQQTTVPEMPGGRGTQLSMAFSSEISGFAVWQQLSTEGSSTDVIGQRLTTPIFVDGFESGNTSAWQ